MKQKNILWIMCDQLRFDYLSCTGHPHLHTPNIDRLAQRGVRFSRAYVQSPICGPSRMSYYTGRYVRSHGATWVMVPMRVGEPTLGVHLNEIGVRNVLVGKTHMAPDLEGMKRLGIDADSFIGVREAQCGFEPYERDDGLVPAADPNNPTAYNAYLNDKGYDGDNPWEAWANSGIDEEGRLLSGWLLAHADKPARVAEPDSETPYMTRRAMQFMREARDDGRPWCLHLSYIKPHWPYIVPAPYHDMYGSEHVIPALRHDGEREAAHPLYDAYMNLRVSKAFSDDHVRKRVIPAYMGLIKQIDDQIGLLLHFLDENGLADNTLIAFTSDHGDYLGDHWMGEKELFHDVSVKTPLILYDPDPSADLSRGTVCDELVEAIDLAPTFLEYFGGDPKPQIHEGRSLMPFLRGERPGSWRKYLISEYDYSMRKPRTDLDIPVRECGLVMVADKRWKYVYANSLPPMLFDLENDPNEYNDLGRDPEHEDVRRKLYDVMTRWALQVHNRIAITDDRIAEIADRDLENNIPIGYWDEQELEAARREKGLIA
ncbi:MAG: sulfatase-like hydrolase/transferase [Alphaproteobacteria bacterium]